MLIDDIGSTCFRYELADYELSFAALDRDEEDQTLMYFRTFEQHKFLAISVWLAERQHLWAEWRAISEATNGHELGKHLASIQDGPFEPFADALLIVEPTDEPAITIAAQLPTRRVEILRHRFQTPGHRDAFLDWVNNGSADSTKWGLGLMGLLQGRKRLASHIDGVVRVQLALLGTSDEDRAVVKAAEREFGQRVLRALEAAARAENDDND